MLNRVGLGSAADAGTFRMGLGLVNVLFSRSVSSYARSQLGARKKIQRNLWPKKEAALKIIWENRKLTRARDGNLKDKFDAIRLIPVKHMHKEPKPQAWVYDLTRTRQKIVELNPEVWNAPIRLDFVHRVVRWQRSHWRLAIATTLSRGETAYSTRKLYRQKGTGRARVGDAGSPTRRGGGRAFAKRVRDYSHRLQNEIKIKGIRTALSAKFQEGNMVILDKMELETHKAKHLKNLVNTYWDDLTQVAFVHGEDELDPNFALAARSNPMFEFYSSKFVDCYNLVKTPQLMVTEQALKELDARLTKLPVWKKIHFVEGMEPMKLIDIVGNEKEKGEMYG